MTNGTKLGDAHARFLALNRVSIRLSFDGVLPAQRARGTWTWNRLDQRLRHLRQHHRSWFARRVSVGTTVTPDNLSHFADSIDYLLNRGIGAIDVAPVVGVSTPASRDLRAELRGQFARVLDASLRTFRKSGRIPLSVFRESGRFQPWETMCGVTEGTKLVVDVDGEVYGCEPGVPSFLGRTKPLLGRVAAAMHLGHIGDPQLETRVPTYRKALMLTGLFGPRERLHSVYGSCRTCAHLGECVVCPMAIAHAPGATDATRVPDFVCAFNQTALDYRAKFRRAVRSAEVQARRQRRSRHGESETDTTP
jgi:sulfatase maturation enzyme AslB (radical SAM superfamily)